MRAYHDLPNLADLYLEDSWVLDVKETPDALTFRLEAALRETHPDWSPRKGGEAHSYRVVDLIFPRLARVDWVQRTMKPITGPEGEVDYGNIDSFQWRPRFFELAGEWGHVRIESDPPLVVNA